MSARCAPLIAPPVSCAIISRRSGAAPFFSTQTGAPSGMKAGSMAMERIGVIDRPIAPMGPSFGERSAILRKNTKDGLWFNSARPSAGKAAHPILDHGGRDLARLEHAAPDQFCPDGAVGLVVLARIAHTDHRPSGIRMRPDPWTCRK